MSKLTFEEHARMNALAGKIADLVQHSHPSVQNHYTWEDAYRRAQVLVMACHHPGADEMLPPHDYRIGSVCWCGEVNTETNIHHTFKAARM